MITAHQAVIEDWTTNLDVNYMEISMTTTNQELRSMSGITDSLEKGAKSGLQHAQRAGGEIGQATEGFGKAAKALWMEGRNAAVDGYERTTEALSEQGRRVYSSGEQVFSKATRYVRENPVRSLGVAALAAYVIGRLMSSRIR